METGVAPLPKAPALKYEFIILKLEIFNYQDHLCESLWVNLVQSQATRPISTGQLHMLPRFHFRPIKQVIFLWP